MASHKLLEAVQPPDEGVGVNMSPLIDLVFLLLIFFMVSSTIIITRIDDKVKIPVAEKSKVAKTAEGRILVNIREDGSMFDVDLEPLADEDAVARYVREKANNNTAQQIRSRLHVRADKNVDVKHIKKAVTGAGAAGVIDVIFSTYVTDK